MTAGPTWTVESATAWRLAALADGWTQEQTYKPNLSGYQGEPVERAATLRRDDGWCVLILARPASELVGGLEVQTQRIDTASVSAWGPDQLAVPVPTVYSWDRLIAGLTRCSQCGKDGDTVRLHFAMRVCPACRDRLAPELEKGNWTE